jgi:P27 family predicted phage terminase small subunit
MTKKPKSPQHLSSATAAWWRNVVRTWTLEEHHIRVLTLAAEAYDRAVEAQRLLLQDGLCIAGREGGLRPHPAVGIRRDAEISFARLLRELDLDVDPPGGSIRPPGLRSNRGGL